MKKMFITVALLVVVCVIFSGCNSLPQENNSVATQVPADVEPDYSLYKPYIQKALDDMPDDDYASARGVLYDVDSNGVDELIMIYDSNNVRLPNSFWHDKAAAYSVYTIDGEKVVALEGEHYLFSLIGAPSGEAYILEDSEQTYLAFEYSDCCLTENDDLNYFGNWYIYILDGKDLELIKDCEYSYYCTGYVGDEEVIDYSRSELKINGKKSDHEEFNNWLKSCTQTEILSYDSDYKIYGLEALMNSL